MTTSNTLTFFTNLELAEKYHGSKMTFEMLAEQLNMNEAELFHRVTLGDMEADEILGLEHREIELDDWLPEATFN